MSQTTAERIDKLDDKQAIFQVKLLLQAVMDSNPAIAAMDDAEIGTKLETIKTDDANVLAEASDIMKAGSTAPLPAKEAGAAAKQMLRLFAATAEGEKIVGSSLEKKDDSADFGLITFPLVCTFLWLAVAGTFDLELGGFRYRKHGLTPDQQAKLLKPLLPTALKNLVKAAFNAGNPGGTGQ
jgi:hypothetical protein